VVQYFRLQLSRTIAPKAIIFTVFFIIGDNSLKTQKPSALSTVKINLWTISSPDGSG